jgi:hypothetical protein
MLASAGTVIFCTHGAARGPSTHRKRIHKFGGFKVHGFKGSLLELEGIALRPSSHRAGLPCTAIDSKYLYATYRHQQIWRTFSLFSFRLIRVVMELLGDRWHGFRGNEKDLAARRSGGDSNPPFLQEGLASRQGEVPHRSNKA